MVTAVSFGNCLLWIKKLLIEPNFNNERSFRTRYIQKIKFPLHFAKFLKASVTVTLSSSCKYFLCTLISLLLIWLLFWQKKLPENTQLCKSFIGVILRVKFANLFQGYFYLQVLRDKMWTQFGKSVLLEIIEANDI